MTTPEVYLLLNAAHLQAEHVLFASVGGSGLTTGMFRLQIPPGAVLYSARLIFNIPTSFHSDFTTQKWRFLKKGPFRRCISTYDVKKSKNELVTAIPRATRA